MKAVVTKVVALIIACCAPSSVLARPGWSPTKVPPVDQAGQDSSFLAFRSAFIEAVQNKDEELLISLVDESVTLDFGGGRGIDLFKKHWRPHDPSSALWDELEWILGHGGAFLGGRRDRVFCAPYVYSSFPSFDAFRGFGAIVGTDVPLRESPSEEARVLRKLSHEVVRAPYLFFASTTRPPNVPDGWIIIETTDGTRGYVHDRTEYRSPIDYRACFGKSLAGWRMQSFVNGD